MVLYAGKERVNTGRQMEIDIAKGLSILFMILVHTLEQISPEHLYISDRVVFVVELLGSPFAAPVFMFAMGVGLVYSRKSTPLLLFRRGLFLIGLGYLLNFLSDVVPALIYYRGHYTSDTLEFMATSFIGADILGFAGMFFLFWALFTRLKSKLDLKDGWLIVIWVLLGIARPFLPNLDHASYWIRGITALIWGSSEESFFPFILWMFYPTLGYFFGQFLMRTEDKNRFYRNTAIVGVMGIAASAVVLHVLSISFVDEILIAIRYYHHGMLFNLIYAGIVLTWFPVCHVLSLLIHGPVVEIFKRWSKNLNALFCFQWIVLGAIRYTPICRQEAPSSQILLVSLFVLIASDVLSCWYLKFWHQVKAS